MALENIKRIALERTSEKFPWAAVDANGYMWLYSCRPVRTATRWMNLTNTGVAFSGEINLPEGVDWKDTLVYNGASLTDKAVEAKEEEYSSSHYDNYYTLTDADIAAGKIKVDAYWVAKQWKTGSRDDSGALWHSLKTIARFGEKNSVEREIKALYNQAKALARMYNVEVESNRGGLD